MAMYQDAKGNWRSGEGSGTQYNYTNTAGQAVNNSGNNGPVYTPASNMSAANANERSAMDSFRANPGSALSQLQNLGGTYAERMKSGDTAGAKTVQDYANSISKVAGVTPQSFSFSGVTAPQAYNPNVNYSNNIPMPQTSSSNIPKGYWENGVFHENKMQTFPGDPNDTSKAWGAGTGPYNSKNDPATDRWGTPLASPTMPNSSTNGMVKDAQGKIIGSYLPGGGFAPATGQGSQQMSVTTPMAYSPNMGIGSFEQSQFGMPQMGAGSNGFAVKTPDQIKAEAKARTDALLAKQTTIAGQTKQGFQTSFDRLASTTKDDRTLQDAAFQRNTNPFSGSTGFQQDMTGRQREISDQQSREDLQTRLANVDLSLADYANATDAQRMQMETDMTNAERAYGMQVDQLALQRQGQALGQFNADRSFNYGVGQDQIKNGQWSQTFNQNQSNADRSFNAGRQDVTYNQGQDQIKNNAVYNGIYNQSGLTLNQVNDKMAANSAAYANASPAEQKRLHDENLYLASLKGSTYDSATGEYSQGNNYVGTKTQDALKNEFNQSVTLNELKFKVDSYKQKFDEDVRQFGITTAIDEAYKKGQLTLQQYNGATSRMQANTAQYSAEQSAANIAFDNKLAASKYELDQLKTGEEKDAAIAKLLDSSPLLQKSYDSRGNVVGNKVADADKKQMEQYIANLGLPAAEAKKWFVRYGLWSDSGN